MESNCAHVSIIFIKCYPSAQDTIINIISFLTSLRKSRHESTSLNDLKGIPMRCRWFNDAMNCSFDSSELSFSQIRRKFSNDLVIG